MASPESAGYRVGTLSWVLAIDIGDAYTTTARASLEGEPELLDIEGDRQMPSGVIWDEKRRRLVAGEEALNLRALYPTRYVESPMRQIDRPGVVMGGRVIAGVDLVRVVLETTIEAGKRQPDDRPDEFRVCHDPSWGPARLEPLRDAATGAAARRGWSGLPVLLVPAPVAVATQLAATQAPLSVDQWLAVYDLGAESFTAAVVRRQADGFELVAANGVGVGGRTLDERLLAHVEDD